MSRVLFFLFLAPVLFAQTSPVRGELRGAPGSVEHLTVYLTAVEHSSTVERAFVSPNGSFQFPSIAHGTYFLEVRDTQGDVITQKMLTVVGGAVETSISLGKPAEAPNVTPGGSTVSVNQLRHDPDGRAAREFLSGEEALLKQDLTQARKHFVKALKIDPDYPAAHTELGITAYRSGSADEARQEFERAIKLDSQQFVAWRNLASLQYRGNEFESAERTARIALEKFPHDAKLHFVAGASRMALKKYDAATAEHLERAATEFPNAHLLLGETLLRLGDGARAMTHLRASLSSDNAQVRARAESLIAKMSHFQSE